MTVYTTSLLRNVEGEIILTYEQARDHARSRLSGSRGFQNHPSRERLDEIVMWFFLEMAEEDPADLADQCITDQQSACGALMDAVMIHGYGFA